MQPKISEKTLLIVVIWNVLYSINTVIITTKWQNVNLLRMMKISSSAKVSLNDQMMKTVICKTNIYKGRMNI